MIENAETRPFAAMDDRALVNFVAEEMRAIQAGGESFMIALPPIVAFQLAAILQLVLRHPELPDDMRQVSMSLLEGVLDWFSPAVAIAEALARGNDPARDVTPSAPAPRLIVLP